MAMVQWGLKSLCLNKVTQTYLSLDFAKFENRLWLYPFICSSVFMHKMWDPLSPHAGSPFPSAQFSLLWSLIGWRWYITPSALLSDTWALPCQQLLGQLVSHGGSLRSKRNNPKGAKKEGVLPKTAKVKGKPVQRCSVSNFRGQSEGCVVKKSQLHFFIPLNVLYVLNLYNCPHLHSKSTWMWVPYSSSFHNSFTTHGLELLMMKWAKRNVKKHERAGENMSEPDLVFVLLM